MLRQHPRGWLDQWSTALVHSNLCFVCSHWYMPRLSHLLNIFIFLKILVHNYFYWLLYFRCAWTLLWESKENVLIFFYVSYCDSSVFQHFKETVLIKVMAYFYSIWTCSWIRASVCFSPQKSHLLSFTDCIGLVPVYSVPCYTAINISFGWYCRTLLMITWAVLSQHLKPLN